MNTLQTIERESVSVTEQIDNLEINHKEDMMRAIELLSSLNRYNDALIEELEKVTIPLKEALRAEEARFKPTKTIFKSAIETLRSKMGEYQQRAITARLEAEQKITDRIKEGKGNLSLETAVKKIEGLDSVDNKLESDIGSVTFVSKDDFTVRDVVILCEKYGDKYILPDEVKIRAEMKAGNKLEGVEYFTSQVVRNSR